jgi:hypothetical protein
MEAVHDTPRAVLAGFTHNPITAVRAFLAETSEFVEEQPVWPFNESQLEHNVTHWPKAWLRRRG